VTQDIVSLKIKLLGDAVYSQDTWMPQLAFGVDYQKNEGISDGGSAGLPAVVNPTQLGAKAEHGVDYYLAATKVFLAQNLVVNAVLRYTRANEFGLLGFGGDRKDRYSLRPEGTVALDSTTGNLP